MIVQKNGELMSKAENLIDEAVRKGYLQGFQEGRKDARHREENAYRDGHNAGMREMQEDDAYQRGLDDAWDAVRKMERYLFSSCLRDIFGDRDFYTVITRMSASEAIAILEDYEKKETKSKAQAEPEQEPESSLDDAIVRAEEKAKANEAMCESYSTDEAKAHIRKCAEDHRQLAEWLRELKERRAKE